MGLTISEYKKKLKKGEIIDVDSSASNDSVETKDKNSGGLTIEEYKKLKDNGQINYDVDTVNNYFNKANQYINDIANNEGNQSYEWANTTTKDYSKKIEDLQEDSQYVEWYLDSIKDTDQYDTLSQQFEQYKSALSQTKDYLDEISNYASSFNSEEAYNAEITEINRQQKYKDYTYGELINASNNTEDESEAQWLKDTAAQKQLDEYETKYEGLSYNELLSEVRDDKSTEENEWLKNKAKSVETYDEAKQEYDTAHNRLDEVNSLIKKYYDAELSASTQAEKQKYAELLDPLYTEANELEVKINQEDIDQRYNEKLGQKENEEREEKYKGLNYTELLGRISDNNSDSENNWLQSKAYEVATSEELQERIDSLSAERDQLVGEQMSANPPTSSLGNNQSVNREESSEYAKKLSNLDNEIANLKTNKTIKENSEKAAELENVIYNTDFTQNSSYIKSENENSAPSLTESNLSDPDEVYNIINTGEYGGKYSPNYTSEPVVLYMTDLEKAIYNYYYNTGQKDKAIEYTKTIERDLNERFTQSHTDQEKDYAKEHPYLASLKSLGTNFISGTGVFEDIGNTATGQPVDINSPAHLARNETNAIRSEVNDRYFEDSGVLGYNNTMSLVDSSVNMAFSTILTGGSMTLAEEAGAAFTAEEYAKIYAKSIAETSSFIMGSQVATQTVVDAKSRGLSDDQAVTLGVLYGIVEGVSEKYSIEYMLKNPKSLLSVLAKGFVAEGSEEVVANWGDRLADRIVEYGEDALTKKYEKYLEEGYSDTDAAVNVFWDCLGEDKTAFLVGGVGGVFMGGTHMALNGVLSEYKNNSGNYKIAEELVKSENKSDLADLIKAGKTFDNDSKKYKLAEKIERAQNEGDKISTDEVSELVGYVKDRINSVYRVSKDLMEYDSKKFDDATEGLTESEKDVASSISGKFKQEQSLTKDEFKLIKNNPKVLSAISNYLELDEDEVKTNLVEPSTIDNSKYYKSENNGLIKVNGDEFTGTVEIASINQKTGEASYRLTDTDGSVKVVKARNINEWKSDEEAAINAEAAKNFTNVDEANAFVRNYNGENIEEYRDEWNLFSNYGRLALDLTKNNRMNNGYILSDELKNTAYAYGLDAFKSNDQMRTAAALEAEKSESFGYTKGIYIKDISPNTKITDAQKDVVRVLRFLSRNGLNVEVFESEADEKGNYKGENGSFDSKTKTLRVDIHAGYQNNAQAMNEAAKYLMLNTVAHELTHVAENSKLYTDLRTELVRVLELNGEDYNKLVENKVEELKVTHRYDDKSSEELLKIADSEVVADCCETMLQVTKLFEDICVENPSLGKRFINFIKKVISKISQFFKNNSKYANNEYAQKTLEAMEKIPNQLQELWDKAVAEGIKVTNAGIEENATEQENSDRAYLKAVKRGKRKVADKIIYEEAKAAGYTVKLYHGTNTFGFTEIDPKKGDDGISFFATTNEKIAQSYGYAAEVSEIGKDNFKNYTPNEIARKVLINYYADARYFSKEDIEGKKDYLTSVINRLTSKIINEQYAEIEEKHIDDIWKLLHGLSEDIKNNDIEAIKSKYEYANNNDILDQNQYSFLNPTIKELRAAMAVCFTNEDIYSYDGNLHEPKQAEALAETIHRKSGVYALYGKTDNLLKVEGEGRKWNEISYEKNKESLSGIEKYIESWRQNLDTRIIAKYAYENGYDGVKITNISDSGAYTNSDNLTGDVYVYFNGDGVKSADTVTYDDNGEIIPPSERFNSEVKDIRYSDRGSENNEAANAGVEESGSVEYSARTSDNDSIKNQLKSNSEKLNSSEVVDDVKTPVKFESKRRAREWAVDRLKASGYFVDRINLGRIEFNEKLINKALDYLNDDEEFAAFACLPRVLKRGIIISGHENHKARGYETITIGAAIKLNGQRVNMAVVVKVDKKSNKYKVHRILTPNNSKVSFNEKTEPTPSGAAKEAVTPTIGSVYNNSISQSDSKSNSSSQQNSDRFDDGDLFDDISEEYSDLLDLGEDLFSSDNQKLIDRLIEAEPETALIIIRQIAEKTVENSISETKSVKLTDSTYQKIARRIMTAYEIRQSKDAVQELANYIKEFTEKVENHDYSEFSDLMNDLIVNTKAVMNYSGSANDQFSEAQDWFIDRIKKKTLIVTNEQESYIRENYGSLPKYRSALGYGYIGLEKNLKKQSMLGQPNGIYISDLLEEARESFPSILDDTANEVEGFGWLERIVNGTSYSTEQKNWYDNSTRLTPVQVGFDITSSIIEEKARQLVNDKKANQKLIKTGTDAKKLAAEQRAKIREAVKNAREQERQKAKEDKAKAVARERAKTKAVRESKDQEIKELRKSKNEKIKEIRDSKNKIIIAERQKRQNDLRELRDKHEKNHYTERIKKLASKFQQMALKPNDKSYVLPEYLSGFYEVAIGITEAIKLSDNTAIGARLTEVSNLIRKLAKEESYSGEFDELFRDQVEEFAEAIKDKKINKNLTVREAEDIYRILRRIDETIRHANTLIDSEERRSVYEAGETVISEQQDLDTVWLNKRLNLAKKYFMTAQRLSYLYNEYNDNAVLVKLMDEINNGVRRKNTFYMQANKMFNDYCLQNVKELDNTKKNVRTIEWTDNAGNKRSVDITGMQAMQIAMTWNREAANGYLVHMKTGGLTIANAELLAKGNLRKAVINSKKILGINYNFITAVANSLTDFEVGYIKIAESFFNEMSSDAINETSMKLRHYKVAGEKYYIPIKVDKNSLVKEIDGVKHDSSIEGMGVFKSVVPESKKPIYIFGLDNVINQHINEVANYYGLAIPIRNLNKVLNVQSYEYDENGKAIPVNSVRDALQENWGDKAIKMYEQVLIDLQNSRAPKGEANSQELNKAISTIRSNFVTSTLSANPSVSLKQAASLLTAGAYLDMRSIAKGLVKFTQYIGKGKYQALLDEIDSHTATHYMRRQGLSSNEVADISSNWINKALSNTKAGRKLTTSKLAQALPSAVNPNNWIQDMDCLTTAILWVATKEQVNKEYNKAKKEIGTDEYWDRVTELYDKTIEDTQPMYDPLHRPEVLKTSNELLKSVFMFKTQPLQNAGVIYDALGRFAQDPKNAESRKALGKAIASQAGSLVVFALMSLSVAFLTHRMNRYRDDDDELTTQSVFERLFMDILINGAGVLMPFGGVEIAGAIFNGDEITVQDNVVSQVSDFFSAGYDLVQTIRDTTDALSMGLEADPTKIIDSLKDFATIAAQDIFGIPVKNIWNDINSPIQWIEDAYDNDGTILAPESQSNKQLASKYGKLIESGDTAEASTLLSEYYNTKLEEAKNNDKVTNPENTARAATRNMLVNAYKEQYQKAFLNNDTAEQQKIVRILNSAKQYMTWGNGKNKTSLVQKLEEWRKSAKDDIQKKY